MNTVTLNPSIVGQAEKAHGAILKRILAGTGLDERQWITVQLALGAGASIGRGDLVERVGAAAKFDPPVVEAATSALITSGLLAALPGAGERLAVTDPGRDFVGAARAEIAELIGAAYGAVPPEDLATAARVLTTITAKLSEQFGTV
jgi:hypothetical protein